MTITKPDTLFSANYRYLAATEAAPVDGVFIPLSALSGLTPQEADAANGDGRKVFFEILKVGVNQISAVTPDGVSATRLPPTGISETTIRQTYQITFDLDVSGSDLVRMSS